MSTTVEIKNSVYAKLLDEREDLSPEEEALAEMLTLLIEDYEEKYYPLPGVSRTIR